MSKITHQISFTNNHSFLKSKRNNKSRNIKMSQHWLIVCIKKHLLLGNHILINGNGLKIC